MRFLLLLFLTLSTTFAIIDISSIDFGEKDNGFSGSLYGSFQKKRGNLNKEESEYGGRLQFDTNKSVTWLQGSVEYDEVSDYATDDNAFVHLRHIHQIFNPSWGMEFYVQLKQDKFKNLYKRTVIGTGPRCKIVDSPRYGKLFFGASVMDEKIIYNELDPDEHNYRVSTYLSYAFKVNKTFELSYLGYYQINIDTASDYLTSSIGEMTIHLANVFDLSYLIEFDYDSRPPQLVGNTDTRQKLSLIYRFGQNDPLSAYALNILNSSNALKDTSTEVSEVRAEVISRNTLEGEYSSENESLSILNDGKGRYTQKKGLYIESFTWKFISAGESKESVKDQQTRVLSIQFVDEEGRAGRTENYLWSKNTLLGLLDGDVRLFTR